MIYENLVMDEERALYAISGARVAGCVFEGPADGESALKECKNIEVEKCDFALKYPLWHVTGAEIADCKLRESCRAPMWYSSDMRVYNTEILGVKALRECARVSVARSSVHSAEFGWKCARINIEDSEISAEYAFFDSRELDITNLRLKGKYSFQYVESARIINSVLDTKDAFWHSKNVTVSDSIVTGEYLGWYSENLRLVRCVITGTQPLCYARGLILEDCKLVDADLCFENSDVRASVNGHIVSVKNPISGEIIADSIGEIILDEHLPPRASCDIRRRA